MMRHLTRLNLSLNLLLILGLLWLEPRGALLLFLLAATALLLGRKEAILEALRRAPSPLLLLPLLLVNPLYTRDALARTGVLLLPLLFFFFLALLRREAPPVEKPLPKLLLLLGAVYLLSLFSFQGQIFFSGDEPHYLAVADSILQDGDLNIANNQSLSQTRLYWSGSTPLPFHGYYGKGGVSTVYSFHLPALSVMLLPFFLLGKVIGSPLLFFFLLRLGMIFWALAAAREFFLLLKDLGFDSDLALFTSLAGFSLTPYLFFATHIYPEIPVTFLILFALRRLYFSRVFSPLTASLALAVLLWTGAKSLFIVFFLLLPLPFKRFRELFRFRSLAAFWPLLLSGVLFLLYLYHAYGTLSILPIYYGILTPEQERYYKELIFSFKYIPPIQRIDSLFNYWFDQRDGLLFYFPLGFLFFPGLCHFFKRKFSSLWFLLLPFGVYVFNYAFNTHRGGYCPPARPLGAFVWMMVLLAALFLKDRWERRTALPVAVLLAFTLFFTFFLTLHPLFLYQPTTHEFTERATPLYQEFSNSAIYWPDLIGSFLKGENLSHRANLFWILFAALFAFGWKRGGRGWGRLLAIFLFGVTLVTLLMPRFSLKKYPESYPVADRTLFLRTSNLLAPTPEGGIELFGGGEKFIPLLSARQRGEVRVRLKGIGGGWIGLYQDRRLLRSGNLKPGENWEVRLSEPALFEGKNLFPLYVRTEPFADSPQSPAAFGMSFSSR